MRAPIAAVLLATAAPARAEPLQFALPLADQAPRAKLCLGERGPCGGLDEEGLLPVRLAVGPQVVVWLGEERLHPDRQGIARLDLLRLWRPVASFVFLESRAIPWGFPVRLSAHELRFEGPHLARTETVELWADGMLRNEIAARLLREAEGPMPWAAPHDPARPGPHPLLRVTRWAGSRRAHDDLGRFFHPACEPRDATLGSLELVATVDVTPVVVGRCRRCAVGDFGWPEIDFRCVRVRADARVRVHAAQTGALVATRRFRGVEPGRCGENVSHLAVRGGTSPDIDPWLRQLVDGPR